MPAMGNLRRCIKSNRKFYIFPPLLKSSEDKMRKCDKWRGIVGIWGLIVILAILGGFAMGFGGEVKG